MHVLFSQKKKKKRKEFWMHVLHATKSMWVYRLKFDTPRWSRYGNIFGPPLILKKKKITQESRLRSTRV